jgi:hypothetical protein
VPTLASDDGYPDEYEGDFDVVRIAERPGKPIAIAVVGEHGSAWLATSVVEYAELARKAQEAKQPIRLHVDRVGDKLEIMRVIGRKEVVR